MHRLAGDTVAKMLQISGLSDVLQGEGGDLLPALVDLASLAQGLYLHDKARVYAEAVRAIETFDRPIPQITEELFFDKITQEIAEHVQTQQRQGSGLREEVRQEAERPGIILSGLEEGNSGNPAGQHRRRSGSDGNVAPRLADETPEEDQRTRSPERSGGSKQEEDLGW